jgi:hypothetical protein
VTNRRYKFGLQWTAVWAWLLMLTLGGVHASAEVIPALGYLPCLGIAALLSIAPWEYIAEFSWDEGSR